MQCEPGCGACCGPVPCKPAERQAVEAYAAAHGVTPLRQGTACPYYQGGACAVYPVRPFLCRLFGHSPKMVCKHGHNVNVPAKKEARAMAEYTRGGWVPDYLHAAVYSDMELLEVIIAGEKDGVTA